MGAKHDLFKGLFIESLVLVVLFTMGTYVGIYLGLKIVNKEVAMEISIEEVAQVAHEINKAYCEAIGDDSQPDWKDAPQWQKDSALAGVLFHMENVKAGPEASHDNWLKQKQDDGWKLGTVKDEAKKEHPCMVEFKALPIEQQVKDHLFRQVVHSLLEVK